MLPFIQIDKEDSSLYLTDAHRIVNLELARESRRSKKEKSNRNRQIFNIHSSTDDVKGFIKKESCFFSFSELVSDFYNLSYIYMKSENFLIPF